VKFAPELQQGELVKRYKRFLADVRTSSGALITMHCPNTGSMLNCQDPGSRLWYSTSDNPRRKYPHTWEIVETAKGDLVGINTGRANQLVDEALEAGMLTELKGYSGYRKEVKFGEERSRIDFLLNGDAGRGLPDCYVEVKNVSLGVGGGLGLFPDAVTVRGQKHLRELVAVKSSGQRAVLLFCVQHSGIERVAPADSIDPGYGVLLREAAAAGVELLAYGASLSAREITLSRPLPVELRSR
jgi:sugar fermentation stimulation protein A